jgi:transposase-like protein
MLRGHGSKMPRLLNAAVEAYLEERHYGRAARRIGIARSTLCRWSKTPEFRRFLDQVRQGQGEVSRAAAQLNYASASPGYPIPRYRVALPEPGAPLQLQTCNTPMARSPAEVLRLGSRRLKAAEMYLRGTTSLTRIAHELGVHKSQISRDFKIIKARWRDQYTADLNTAKQRELAKIDGLEAAAWQTWERSCQDAETLHSGVLKGRTDKDGNPLPDVQKSYKTVHGQTGDARFLELVHTCIAQRCKILGLMPNRPDFGGGSVNVATTGPVVFYIPQNGRDSSAAAAALTWDGPAPAAEAGPPPAPDAVKVVLPEPDHG